MADTFIKDLPIESNPQSADYLVGDFGTPPRTKKVAVGSLSAGATPGTATTSQTLSATNLTYVKADGTLALADATAEGKEAISFVKTSYGSGVSAQHYFSGVISGFSGLTPGANYFMSRTPGAVTSDVSAYTTGNVIMKIGNAISATEIYFNPQIPVTK